MLVNKTTGLFGPRRLITSIFYSACASIHIVSQYLCSFAHISIHSLPTLLLCRWPLCDNKTHCPRVSSVVRVRRKAPFGNEGGRERIPFDFRLQSKRRSTQLGVCCCIQVPQLSSRFSTNDLSVHSFCRDKSGIKWKSTLNFSLFGCR
jgi:hypothetical protein